MAASYSTAQQPDLGRFLKLQEIRVMLYTVSLVQGEKMDLFVLSTPLFSAGAGCLEQSRGAGRRLSARVVINSSARLAGIRARF